MLDKNFLRTLLQRIKESLPRMALLPVVKFSKLTTLRHWSMVTEYRTPDTGHQSLGTCQSSSLESIFYLCKILLRDMYQQVTSFASIGPIVVTQKVVVLVGDWGKKNQVLMLKKSFSLQSALCI